MTRKAESLRITAPSVPAYDVDEANRLVDEAFAGRGWLLTDESGETYHAVDKLRHTLFNAFTTDHIVTTAAVKAGKSTFNEMAAQAAVPKYRLYIELFPNGPGAQQPPTSPEEHAAREFLVGQIWRLCTPTNRKAWLQNELAASNLVVLETRVFSDDPGVAPEPGRYVTNVEQAMLDFLEHKIFEDVRKKLAEADQWLATFAQRNPDIALPAAKKARAALKAAVDSAIHANPAYIKSSLPSATSDETDDEVVSEP